MKTKSNRIFAILFANIVFLLSHNAYATYNGWATPTSITYNFTSLSANNDSGTSATLISNPFSVTFLRTDSNFASVAVSNISIPYGRYLNVGLCSTGTINVTLNGVKFDGYGGIGGLQFGDTIYTASATNSVGAINTTGPAVALNYTRTADCTITWFPSPLCVTDSSQSSCRAGDLVYADTGAATNSKGDGKGKNATNASFKVSLMIDLYDGVAIDGTSGQALVLSVPNVMAVIGDPGAAVHITKQGTVSSVPFNASLLFGPDKTLLTAYVSQGGGATTGSPLSHSCQGTNNVAITGASSNFPYLYLSSVSTTANSGKGQVLFPMVSACQTVSTCNSSGVEQIDNLFQAVGSSATLQCVADSSSSYQTTNFSNNYTGSTGASAGTDTATIVRIVDPNNIFGVCSSSPCVDTSVASNGGYY